MVCSFFYYVLPALIISAFCAFWLKITGREPEMPVADTKADSRAPAAKGVCPYHVMLKFFGFKVPEKKTSIQTAASEESSAQDTRLKAE